MFFLVICFKIRNFNISPKCFILVGSWYSLKAFNFDAHHICSFPHLLRRHPPKNSGWNFRGLTGPSGSLKSTSRPPQQPEGNSAWEITLRGLSNLPALQQDLWKSPFFFFEIWYHRDHLPSFWLLTFSSCVSLSFSEPRNRFHQWLCPNRILSFFLAQQLRLWDDNFSQIPSVPLVVFEAGQVQTSIWKLKKWMKRILSLKLTVCTWKWMLGMLVSFLGCPIFQEQC